MNGSRGSMDSASDGRYFMKPMKDFNCVQMKWDIQQKLLEEERLLGPEEAHRKRAERMRNDPIPGPFLKRMRAQELGRATDAWNRSSARVELADRTSWTHDERFRLR
jgi:hypothetical protein